MQAFIQTLIPQTLKSWRMITPLLALLLVLTVACGTATAPDTTAPDTTAPDTTAPEVGAAPTAVPEAMAEPAKVEVHPGKVTWLVGSLSNERFDSTFVGSPAHDYQQPFHAYPIGSDVVDGQRIMTPGIATKWEISSDSLTWIFTIRKGVKWHDGTDLTAEDVLWTFQHRFGPQAQEYASGTSANISVRMDRIEQTGPHQVSVTTKVPISGLPGTLSDSDGTTTGSILPKRATLRNEEEEAAYDLNPIGAGVLKLVKHVPVDLMAFERFADYYHQPENGFSIDKRVNFAAFDLRLVPEEATRVAAIRAGEADIAPVNVEARKQVEAGGGRLVFGQEGVFFHIANFGCWNRTEKPFPCDDRRVRQALLYAIDKELIRDALYGPEVMVVKGWGPVTPSTIGYSPELDPYPFDPEKARQLLTAAGYKNPDNPDGKDFGKMIINTQVSPVNPKQPDAAQLGASFWKKELGLDVEVKVWEKAAFSKVKGTTEDLHGQVSWRDNETRVDAAGILVTHHGNPGDAFRPTIMHRDPELYALVDKAVSVTVPEKREQALNSIYRRLREEAFYMPIGYLNVPWAVGPRILTWEPYPLAYYPSGLHSITLK